MLAGGGWSLAVGIFLWFAKRDRERGREVEIGAGGIEQKFTVY